VLYLPALSLPDTVARFIAAQVAEHRERRRAWGRRWVEIPSTGSSTLDSLSRRFGAARVVAQVDSATGSKLAETIAMEYARPMNVARIEAIYEAAGFFTYAPFRNLTTWFYPSVVWTSLPDADLFHFRLESDCRDPCHRHERYLVRVPLGPGPAVMVEREVRIDPDH